MSSLNLNKVVLCGRLTATPELKQTTGGVSVCTFTLAVNRRFSKEGEQQADFITVVAWRQTAEFITKYFDKGNSICITGSIQTRTWKDSKGEKRYATEVVADEAMFVDSKSEEQPTFQQPTFKQPTTPRFEDLKTDESLPF
jgi:single-strand DNA-binding protein